MKKTPLYLLFAVAMAHSATVLAQGSQYTTQNNQYRQAVKAHTDQNGQSYYLDQNGTPYYIDKDGYAYYIDAKGNAYYIDQYGQPYYLDQNGNPYYLDKDGYAYFIDANGNAYYIDQYGQPYYLDQNGNPYYPNQQNQPNQQIEQRPSAPQKEFTQTQPSYQSEVAYPQIDDDTDRFRIAVGGGYTFRLGKRTKYINNAEKEKVSKDLMHGFNIDADAQYFFNPYMGVGANFNYVSTSSSLNKIKQQFMYVGPSFVLRSDIGTSFLLIYNLGVGALFFTESSNIDSDYTKTTFAFNTGISGEYKLSRNLGVGLRLSTTIGSINSYKHNGIKYDLDDNRNVSSFNITGFVSFRAK